MSANRKYTQLTIEDLDYLIETVIAGEYTRMDLQSIYTVNHLQSDKTRQALRELRDKARAAKPGSSICLAYAVLRGAK